MSLVSVSEEETIALVKELPVAGQVPWNGLSVDVDENDTPKQILKKAGLDWKVEKVGYTYHHNGKEHKSTRLALVKEDDSYEFTAITGDWEPVQNIEGMEFFYDCIRKGKMRPHAVGSLRHGQIVFALAQVSEPMYLFGGDRIDPYFLFTLAHEYGRATDLRFTPLRFECANTLMMALRGNDIAIKLNHRKKLDPESIKRLLGLADDRFTNYIETVKTLGAKRAIEEDVLDYLKGIFPSVSEKNKHEKISRPAQTVLKIMETQPGAEFAKGSWWQVINAVTYAMDHLLGRSAEARIYNSWYQTNKTKKWNAYNLAIEAASKSPSI